MSPRADPKVHSYQIVGEGSDSTQPARLPLVFGLVKDYPLNSSITKRSAPARHRLIPRGLAVLPMTGLLVLGLLAVIPGGRSLTVTSGDATLSVSTDHRWAVWPFDCVKVAWTAEQVAHLSLNGEPVPGTGARVVCEASAYSPALVVTFPDGGSRAYAPDFERVRMTPVLFLILLLIELLLLDVAMSNRPRISTTARALVFIVPLMLTLGLRIHHAFSTTSALEWDETYYTSIAVTAAAGDGLYPYIFGFGPMPAMGGIGYATYTYALAVKLFGPTIFGLRAVSLFASILGLAGVWVLVKTWYGSGTAWMATALTSSLNLFVLSNSARMDSWTFAYVTWGLVVVAFAVRRWGDQRWHLFAGLMFGLGLQVHIDTIATAMACGILYLVQYLRDAHAARRVVLLKHPMFMYISGVGVGLIIYVCLNILPDTSAYYRTTVLVRVDATGTYSGGTSSIIGSFLNPHILLSKEATRYRQLFAITPMLEIGLGVVAIMAMTMRRNAADKVVLTLLPAVPFAAAVVLNNASPLYYIHVLPALIIPLAPLFTHGITGQSTVSLGELKLGSILAFVVVLCGISATSDGKTLKKPQYGSTHGTLPSEAIQHVRALVDRRCKVAGDGGLYVRYFADYPYYVSLRDTEVRHGMLYYGTIDETAYWQIKQPDVVFDPGHLRAGLSDYVARNQLIQVEPGLWIRPDGCRGGP
jgi:hypothetical protein